MLTQREAKAQSSRRETAASRSLRRYDVLVRAGVVLTTAIGLVGCATVRRETRRNPAVIVLSNATNVRWAYLYDGQVSYTVREAYPAKHAIETIQTRLRALRWRPRQSDLLALEAPPPIRTEWTETEREGKKAIVWFQLWENDSGDAVRYDLLYWRKAKADLPSVLDVTVSYFARPGDANRFPSPITEYGLLRHLGSFWFQLLMLSPSPSETRFHGIIFHGPGYQLSDIGLEPRTHTIEGSFSGPGAMYHFALASREASIVSGSFHVLQGPVLEGGLSRCAVTFANESPSKDPIPFRFEFTVQKDTRGDCSVRTSTTRTPAK